MKLSSQILFRVRPRAETYKIVKQIYKIQERKLKFDFLQYF